MSGTLGFRILPSPPRMSSEALEKFPGAGSAVIADAMGRFGSMDPAIESRTGNFGCGSAWKSP